MVSFGIDLNHVIKFFRARKKPSGGFGQSPRLPATIEDTYYALRTLSLMKEKGFFVPTELFESHEGFLLEKLAERDLGARSFFQLTWCLKALNISYEISNISVPKGAISLESLFYLRRMGVMDRVYRMIKEQVVKTVREVRMYLFIRGRGLDDEDRKYWMAWLRACQNPDGGLGFMPNTTSFIENCYYGVKALEAIDAFTLDIEPLINFVLSSKSGRGGFGRRNLGVPFPSSTWHGVGTLLTVQKLIWT